MTNKMRNVFRHYPQDNSYWYWSYSDARPEGLAVLSKNGPVAVMRLKKWKTIEATYDWTKELLRRDVRHN